MFALHDTTRKRLCRTAFFALCLAPTLATAAWIGTHYVPGRKGRIARELGATLDVHVKLAEWRQPRPRVVRSSQLTLSDASSGRVLAQVDGLELRQCNDLRTFSAEELTIDDSQRERLGEKLYGWLTNLSSDTHDVLCAKLTIKPPPEAASQQLARDQFVLQDVRGRVDRDAAGRVRAQITARVSKGVAGNAAVIRLTLAPATHESSAAPTLTLDAHSASIPAWVLAGFVPGCGNLGANARYTGVVQWSLDEPLSLGIAQGRIDAVDLSSMLPAGSPHRLQGAAAIELSEMRWRDARLERFVGAVRATEVHMSRSLVEVLATNFQCGRNGEGTSIENDASLVAVDLLAIQFELDGKGLTIWGNCPPEMNLPEGCMVVSGRQPLLFGPRFRDWPLGMLVQTLAAPSSASLPATREAVDLAERLPLPLR